MKRIDTLTEDALFVLEETIGLSRQRNNKTVPFQCQLMGCSQCPFERENVPCYPNGQLVAKTADEWRAWAEEEV